ncbi:LolA family protein [Gillisia limnaea]|uniref:Outer membrane lipoprotein carrier protein LolA n=1 Tax=Gillisia limnaea (strain DSM 15749 / LMG 21470 / R-8282) TaxID=865937 RepID=H2BV23_GILLR|nr:outer membrane lipoprotein carrier protein LolA [Gillisia limnaea]EHQ03913.1 outer membrane lipoprotein carrier protein LolA [Gillisia limnaea DSM 15749]
MRIIKILLFLFSVSVFAQQTPISASAVKDFRENVERQADEIQTMSGDFLQVKYMRMMQAEAVSSGKLYFKSPDILKWEYYKPYNYKILFKDAQLHINDEGEKSVTNLGANKLFEKLFSLISGSMNGKLLADTKNFDFTYVRVNNDKMVVLIPRDPSLRQMFAQIVLIFNSKNLVNSVKLVEDSGDFTEIYFKNVQINKPIDPSIFED